MELIQGSTIGLISSIGGQIIFGLAAGGAPVGALAAAFAVFGAALFYFSVSWIGWDKSALVAGAIAIGGLLGFISTLV